MSKFFLDTEFHEYQKKPLFGKPIDTIELISIGMVDENGNEYYAICKEFDLNSAWDNEWLRKNVLHPIYMELFQSMTPYHKTYFPETTEWNKKGLKRLLKWSGISKSKEQIAKEIKEFVYYNNQDLNPKHVSNFDDIVKTHPFEFYAYYADYDWVVFCWLFGRMIDLPKGFPMYCRDLKQILDDKVGSMDIGVLMNKVGYTPKEIENAYETCRKMNTIPDRIKLIKSHNNYPTQQDEHNALDDAKWNLKLYNFIKTL